MWTNLFNQETHWESFIQHSQFPIFTLLVIWITKDTSIQQCPVDIGDHGTDISSRIGFTVGWVLDGFEVLVAWLVEMHRVAFVEGVDFAPGGNLDFRMGEDELSEGLFVSTQ